MTPEKLYQLLGELLNKLGVSVRVEYFDPKVFAGTTVRGGMCRIGNRTCVLVDAGAPIIEQVCVLASAASRLDCRHVYVVPAVRQAIEEHRWTTLHSASDPLKKRAKLRPMTNPTHQSRQISDARNSDRTKTVHVQS